ncbi:venom metalloproteinase antarease-like TserMP_B isoform X2 [Amblyomma americanum]
MHSLVAIALLFAAVDGLQEPRLVYPRLLQERSHEGKLVMEIDDQLTLNLEKASIAAPQLRVLKGGEESMTVLYDGNEINDKLYQDGKQFATVAVEENGTIAQLKGLVGPSHRIEPLPAMERSDSGLIPHMIYEIEQMEMNDKALSFVENEKYPVFSARNGGRVPDEVVVEVFFVLDHPHYRHFKNIKDALMYICIMMNSANLRYIDVHNPRVKLMVTGAEQPSGEEYVRGTSELLADSDTLKQLKIYAGEKKSQFGNPDIVFLLSGRDVITESKGKWDKNGLGVGYVSGVCSEYFVALGEDKPGLYTGMITLTHELAHVLGAVHDGEGPYSQVSGHPGAKACPWDDGFVMSYVNKDARHQIFSLCSVRQIEYVLGRKGQQCWDVASGGYNMSTQYPGNKDIIDAICKTVYPDKQVESEMACIRGHCVRPWRR